METENYRSLNSEKRIDFMAKYVITIDGPAASGKSSVSREVASHFGWEWLSTGAFYRGLALIAQLTKTPLDNESKLVELATSPRWQVKTDPVKTRVVFEGKDVTDSIYMEEVGDAASKISHFPKVREALLEAQRAFGRGSSGGLVAEGRDCGTVVFPQAHVKIYLTAHSESRASRRAKEEGTDHGQILEKQKIRDDQDQNRKAAPLQVPENAQVVDTSEMNLEQVVDWVEALIQARLKL